MHELTKMAVKERLLRTTSVACTNDPQMSALLCLQSNDLQAFTDLLNTKDVENGATEQDFWIYSPIKEEGGLNLVELVVQQEATQFLKVLISLGVRVDFLNLKTGYAAIHQAVIQANPQILQLITSQTRPDFDVNVRAGRMKRGYTALHLAAENTTNNHQQCLDILLEVGGVDVNVLDSSATVTPIYLAAKNKNEYAVRKLIECGARLETKIGRSGKTVEDYVVENLPSLDPRTIRVKRFSPKDENAKDKMLELVRETTLDSPKYFQNFIKFRHLSLGVVNASTGYQDLVEKCCRKGLYDFAQVLFNKNADPSRFDGGSLSAPVLVAAERADFRLLQVLKKVGADFSVEKLKTAETVLHLLLKNYDKEKENDYLKSMQVLLDEEENKFRTSISGILNRKDLTSNTPLHYATEKCPESIIRVLLQRGSNIGIKNLWGEIPISRISPMLLEDFLDEDCLTGTGEIYEREFSLTFKYGFLAPDPQSLPAPFRPKQELDEYQPLNPAQAKPQGRPDALPETESLWYMGQSREHRHLLKHPVITSFLWFKWERMRPYFNRNLRLYLLFVFMLTWFIFLEFGGYSQKQSIRDTFYGMYVALFIVISGLMAKDWIRGLQEDLRNQEYQNDAYAEVKTGSCRVFGNVLTANLLDFIQLAGMTGILLLPHTSLHIPILVLLLILVVRECLQLLVSMKRYILSVENWIEITMLVLVSVILFTNTAENFSLNRHLAAIALVLSWSELITMIGRHPKLLHFNIYVTMFYKVLNSFLMFLVWYSFFIVAFGLGFYIMLHTDTQTDLSGLEDEDKNPLFNRTWLSLVKTSAMFVGELEFSDLPINSSTYLGMVAYSYFLCFVFLIVVVLMNLLNGLAVSDTGDIKAKAEIYSYISRVETISYMESTLLGDPFDFLSNVPSFLKTIPSVSLFRQFYRNGFCRQVFTKLGAKGFLLFYTFLPDKQFTVSPNSRSQLCSLHSDQLGADIIASAKDIVTRKRLESTKSNSTIQISKVDLEALLEIQAKLDILLKTK